MIQMVQGDDKTVTLTLRNSLGGVYDLTGCTLFATVKREYTDADAAALISVSSATAAITITTPVSGVAYWYITPAQTKYMNGLYKYDIQLKDASTKIHTIIVDDFQVDPEVSIRVA